MKILVAVKRVVDHSVRVRLKGDGSGVDLQGVKMAMNPFDEIALEQAIRLKEAGVASEIILVSVGVEQSQEVLRTGIAMGATRAILVPADHLVEPLAVAKVIAAIARREEPALILLGKQAIDDEANQTGQMVAALLGRPQATFASGIVVAGGSVEVTREVDGGLQTVRLALPAVVTADLRLNEPRYPTLPNVMRARKVQIEQVTADDLGVDLSPRLKVLETKAPLARKPGIMVSSVDELVAKLRQEAGVL